MRARRARPAYTHRAAGPVEGEALLRQTLDYLCEHNQPVYEATA